MIFIIKYVIMEWAEPIPVEELYIKSKKTKPRGNPPTLFPIRIIQERDFAWVYWYEPRQTIYPHYISMAKVGMLHQC